MTALAEHGSRASWAGVISSIGDLLSDKLERVLVSSRLQHPDFILVVCQDILVIEGEAEFLSGYGAVVYEIPEDLLCEAASFCRSSST